MPSTVAALIANAQRIQAQIDSFEAHLAALEAR
jgi:hypothetical protein